VCGARRPPRDKSQGYKTTPAEAGFTPKKPTRSDGLYRTLLRSPQIHLRALSADQARGLYKQYEQIIGKIVRMENQSSTWTIKQQA
jgi:hypothetical protein